jgi:hypothetical protein
MSLKDLLQGDISVKHIKIKVLQVLDDNIIVGDSSMMAICCAVNSGFKSLAEGKCYMILKPVKQESNYLIPNEKLKPVKIADFPLNVKRSEIQKLVSIIQNKSSEKTEDQNLIGNNLKTFEDIVKNANKSEIKTVTVKVITISRDIAGSYGNYNIGKFKDKTGQKIDINLYSKQVKNKLKRGDIVELRKLKLTEFSKDGEMFKRLSTTARSTVHDCKSQIETIFDDVPLGDEKEKGTVIAIHDIFPYLSCSKCWKKTGEDDDTCQCGNKENIHINDFHCQFYIQSAKDDDIKIVHTFKRQTELTPGSQDPEIVQKLLEDKYLEKQFTFEWNLNPGEDNLRMVDIS